MPEPVTVWMVRLRKGEMGERKGRMSLEIDGISFCDAEHGEVRLIRFEEVKRVRRVKGSPILIVTHDEIRGVRQTAFYFVPPPPLAPPDPFALRDDGAGPRPMSPFAAMRKSSKRRHMRNNVRYLTAATGNLRSDIQAWVRDIVARLER